MNYAIYLLSTGQICRVVDCSPEALPQQYNAQTEGYLEGFADDTKFYVEGGQLVAIPPSPGEWYTFDFAAKQWVANTAVAKATVDAKRSKLLYASDWTQIPNGPLTPEKQAQWGAYRQELRDIPQQPGYPMNVVWPTTPS